jgi:hypothetical protein
MGKHSKEKEKIVYRIRYYERTDPKDNYLKFWRSVRYWVKRNYDISSSDLEMILFLYDERLFTKHDFHAYGQIQGWDKKRFYRMVEEGWINCWKTRAQRSGKAGLYEVSFEGRRLCSAVYKKLNGEEDFSTSPQENSIFKREKYTDKLYAREMIEINRQNRERILRRQPE